MAERYRVFASHLLFTQVAEDALGHLFRAGEFDRAGVRRTVWLRIFDGPAVTDASLGAGFERARRIGEIVQSVNVASGVRGAFEGGRAAMAHDFVASQPLGLVFERVAAEGFPIPVDNALLVVEKIALALTAALTADLEGSRVVHGFLHPGLIFVTYDGECVVAGFGLGEELLATTGDSEAAAATQAYIAPEILESRVPSRQGDVYSLGAILFQLLTGGPLPVDPGEREAAVSAATMAYDDEAIPDDIRALLSKSLSSRPRERFSSASDFKKELDRLLYGGAYSPTTFNLALFMDRLFRAEIEREERERAAEQKIDVAPYATQPVDDLVEPEDEPDRDLERRKRVPRAIWIAAAAAVVAAVFATVWTVGRGARTPPPTPTPTAAEISAQREAQEAKMRELAQSLVQEMMAEKEQEIRGELVARQARIDELQRQLRESERQANEGRLSNEARRQREELQRQIEAEEEAQRQREAELEAERQRADEAARSQIAAERTATAAATAVTAEPATATPAPALEPSFSKTPVPERPSPTLVPATPTAAPTVVPTITPLPTATVEPDSFVEPTEVDTLPVAIKEHPVEWPLTALRSRRAGVIIIRATVNADGQVVDAVALRADEQGFGIPEAALAAARKYRFRPGTKNGVRVRTFATITVPFRFVAQR